MSVFQFGSFCDSWRSRFLGGRKVWHSHYRGFLVGWRDRYTTVSFFSQLKQVQQALHLLKVVFSRGGQVWCFNLSSQTGYSGWGQFYHQWFPGQFSNSWVNIERNIYLRRFRSSLAGEVKNYTRTTKRLLTRLSRVRGGLRVRKKLTLTYSLVSFKSSYTRKKKMAWFYSNDFRLRAKFQTMRATPGMVHQKKRRASYLGRTLHRPQRFNRGVIFKKNRRLTRRWVNRWGRLGVVGLASFTSLLKFIFGQPLVAGPVFQTRLHHMVYYYPGSSQINFLPFWKFLVNLFYLRWVNFSALVKAYSYNQRYKVYRQHELTGGATTRVEERSILYGFDQPPPRNRKSRLFYVRPNQRKFFPGYHPGQEKKSNKVSRLVSFKRLTTTARFNYLRADSIITHGFYPRYLRLYRRSQFFSVIKEPNFRRLQALSSLKTTQFKRSWVKSYRLSLKLLTRRQRLEPTVVTNWGHNSIKRATYGVGLNELARKHRKFKRVKWVNRPFFFLSPKKKFSPASHTLLARHAYFTGRGRRQPKPNRWRGLETTVFPQLVIGGVLKGKLYSLAVEMENYNLPFVYLYTTRDHPNTAAYGILWNSHPGSSRVWFDLVETTWKYTRFGGLLSLFSRRLL